MLAMGRVLISVLSRTTMGHHFPFSGKFVTGRTASITPCFAGGTQSSISFIQKSEAKSSITSVIEYFSLMT